MKPENTIPRGTSAGRRHRSSMRIPPVPIEWMDPMSWRLPSGKALAEFALQAGFLAPLMLGMPRFKPRKAWGISPIATKIETHVEEAPERIGSFRQTR